MEALGRVIFYGASIQLLIVVLLIAAGVLVVGLIYRDFLWRTVRSIEWTSNTIGRVIAWAGLIMVVQQAMIVMLQRIFRVSEISIGTFGYVFTRDLSWFAEELRLYNASIVALCAAYTFVQGGHVRVDLFYARLAFLRPDVHDDRMAVWLVLHVASSGDAQGVGHRFTGSFDAQGAAYALER